MNKQKVEIHTAFSLDEIEEIIGYDSFNLIKLKIGVKGIIFKGLLKICEEKMNQSLDDKEKQALKQRIDNILNIVTH